MPEYVVHSTAREHGEYQKRQAKKQLESGCLAIAIGLISLSYIYYLAWSYIH